GIPVATLLSGLAVPAFALTVGWRWAFAAAALVPLGGAVALPAGRIPRGPSGDGSPAASGRRRRPPVSLPPLVVLAAGIGFGTAAAGTLGVFLVDAAVASGLGEGPAGLLVSGGSAVGITSRLVVGRLADRRNGGHLRVVAWMLLAGCLAYGLFATGIAALLVLATPLAFGAGWGWPGLFNLAVVRQHPDAAATASGITQTGTYLGAVGGPVLFGTLVEQVSYRAAWLVAGGLAMAGAGAIVAGRRMLLGQRALEELDGDRPSIGPGG
ncbi:MAG: MFS transporter, partial [Actinobacteria bacterium]|nr:MFS transporter [Actinomycetota bacterium]